jgi:hypothetical protein
MYRRGDSKRGESVPGHRPPHSFYRIPFLPIWLQNTNLQASRGQTTYPKRLYPWRNIHILQQLTGYATALVSCMSSTTTKENLAASDVSYCLDKGLYGKLFTELIKEVSERTLKYSYIKSSKIPLMVAITRALTLEPIRDFRLPPRRR